MRGCGVADEKKPTVEDVATAVARALLKAPPPKTKPRKRRRRKVRHG
jgi:hypothetical protein